VMPHSYGTRALTKSRNSSSRNLATKYGLQPPA
jgi:hypothetical protein